MTPPLLPRWTRRWIAAGLVLGLVASVAAAALPRGWVENRYAREFYPRLVLLSGTLLGWTRISFFEWAVLSLAFALLVQSALGLRRWRRRRERLRRILLAGLYRVAGLTGLVYALFVGGWGLAYSREPLPSRHPELGRPVDPGEVRRAALAELAAANRYSLAFARIEPGDVEPAVVRGLAKALDEYESFEAPDGAPAKRFVVLGRLMDLFATSGFCSPWTHEAHVNPSLPPARVPFVLAHELAHQAGYPDETEANFLAWLACAGSGHPAAIYSAHLAMVAYYDAADAYAQGELAAMLDPRVREDLDLSRQWYLDRAGPLSRASSRVYDAYLKAEGVPEGIRSYGLVVRYATAHRLAHPPEDE